ncbi:hypothetical protein V6N13_011478 [Hibiscus sabdariffa]
MHFVLPATSTCHATVRLACKDSKKELTAQFKTDKNGYFFLEARAPNTIYNFSLSLPLKLCSIPSNLNDGLKGAPLKPHNSSTTK